MRRNPCLIISSASCWPNGGLKSPDEPSPNTVRCLVSVARANVNKCFRLFVSDEKAHSGNEVIRRLNASKEGERYANQHQWTSTRRNRRTQILCDGKTGSN